MKYLEPYIAQYNLPDHRNDDPASPYEGVMERIEDRIKMHEEAARSKKKK